MITIFTHVDPYVRTSVPTFQNLPKQNKSSLPVETVGLAEWIIDDSCLVLACFHRLSILIYKTGVVNDPLIQPTIRPSVENYFILLDFEKWGRTDMGTDRLHM